MIPADQPQDGGPAGSIASIFDTEQRLQLLFDSVPAWVCYIAPGEIYRYANKRYRDEFGLSTSDIAGMRVSDVLPVANYVKAKPHLDKAFAGASVKFESTLADATGASRHIQVEYIPDAANGRVAGVITLVTDITERKEAEVALAKSHEDLERTVEARTAKLLESEQRFRRIFEGSPLGMAISHPNGAIAIVNRALCRLFGYKAAELRGLTFLDVTFPEDLAKSEAVIERVHSGTVDALGVEKRYVTKSGDIVWARTTLSVVRDEQNKVLYNITIIEDITEAKRTTDELRVAQERMRAFMENTPDGIMMKDLDGKIIVMNRVHEKWLAAERGSLLGRSALDLYPAEIAEEFQRQDQKVLQSDGAVKFELTVPFLDGHTRVIEFQKFPVRDGIGNIIGIGSVNRDVTAQREAESQLRRAQRMEAVGRLTGGVAHDFNNLLAVIIGNIELVLDSPSRRADPRPSLEQAARAADKGAELVQRLLAFSRAQTLSPEVVQVSSIIRELEDMLRQTLSEAVKIEISAAEGLWPCRIDPGQLENAVLNLAINAGDAMPSGGEFRVEMSNVSIKKQGQETPNVPAGDYVRLFITDTGEGMPPEILSRAVEPFFTTKEVGQGTGLGLSIVHGFVSQSDGYLTIDSEQGKGTRIGIYLPRCQSDESDATSAAPHSAVPTGSGETVLIVEDDPMVRNLVVAQVEELGYVALPAEDGPRAVELAAGLISVDLLLTDIVLPNGMNGRIVADEIRSQQPGVKVLFMSGYSDDVFGDDATTTDGLDLIQKPFRKPDIAQAIFAALRG